MDKLQIWYDYVEQFRIITSAITAFAVLQMLTFAYGLQQESFRDKIRLAGKFVRVCIVGATVLYTAGILLAAGAAWLILSSKVPDAVMPMIISELMKAGAVCLTGAVGLAITAAQDPASWIARTFDLKD